MTRRVRAVGVAQTMTRRSVGEAVRRLNESHPVNRAAAMFLDGYPLPEGELHLLSLLRVAYVDCCFALPSTSGAPCLREVQDVLGFLNRVDPTKAMEYLTVIGERVELTKRDLLGRPSFESAAGRAAHVLLTQLALGAALPTGAPADHGATL